MRAVLIWVLLGSKAGDNAQALHIAKALGQPFEIRNVAVDAAFETAKLRVEASLHHIDQARSDTLLPPWPDLVLTVGRRLSMVALWIKRQSQSRTKVALIGAPKAESASFDLVIAAQHYRIREAANVCRIGLPPLFADAGRLAGAAQIWAPRLASLPRPVTALLVGGSTGKRILDAESARSILARSVDDWGCLYVVTSRRTPPDATRMLENRLPAAGVLYKWRPDDPENPYLGLLALADRFIVTGDSISMLVEVARLGKPLAIAAVSQEGPVGRLLDRVGLGGARDLTLLHDYLYRGGWAVPLGEPFRTLDHPPPDDTAKAVERIRALLA